MARTRTLQNLFDAEEYALIERSLRSKETGDLSYGQRLILARSLAAQGKTQQAAAYREQYSLEDPILDATIALYSGDVEKSIQIAMQAEDRYLAATALLAAGRYNEIRTELQYETIGGRWHLFIGKSQAALHQWPEAQKSYVEAADHFEADGDSLQMAIALLELALVSQHLQNIPQAETAFLDSLEKFKSLGDKDLVQQYSRARIEHSRFLYDQGKLFSALREMHKACHLLRNWRTTDRYAEAHLELAGLLIDFGLAQKAEDVLLKFNPDNHALKLDYHRYRSYAALQLGDVLRARAELSRAHDFREVCPEAAVSILPMDRFQVYYTDGKYSAAFESANRARTACKNIGDLAQLFDCQTDIAYRSFDHQTARETIAYHDRNSNMHSFALATLSLAHHSIREKAFEAAEKTLLKEVPFPLPLDEANRLIHLAVIATHLNSDDTAMTMLDRAAAILRQRDAIELKLMVLELRLRIARPKDSRRTGWVPERLSLRARAGQGILDWIDTWLGRMHFDFQERYFVQQGTLNRWVPSKKLSDFKRRARYTVDLRDQKFYWNERPWLKLDRYPLLKEFMFYLAKKEVPVGKAELVRNVYRKKKYDPSIDDNMIFVGISRLRSLLPENILIESINGAYRLRQSEDVLVIQDSCSPEDWNRFSVESPENPNEPPTLH